MSSQNEVRPDDPEIATPKRPDKAQIDSINVSNNASTPVPPNDTGDTYSLKELQPTPDAQRGVQRMEAVTLAWTKTSLAALLVLYVLTNA